MSDTTQTTDQILTTLNELGALLAWPDDSTMSSYVSEIHQNLADADAGAEAAADAASSVEGSLYDATSYAETASQEAGSAQEHAVYAAEKMNVLGERISALSEIRDTVLGTISERVLGRDNVRILVGVLQMTLTHRFEQEQGEEADPEPTEPAAPTNSPANGTEDLDALRGM